MVGIGTTTEQEYIPDQTDQRVMVRPLQHSGTNLHTHIPLANRPKQDNERIHFETRRGF
jgi:hypothetical protein|tara:strand:- start:1253 stop:1429 length:177 start_codon:yes stop_codon:yes gene_type:complete